MKIPREPKVQKKCVVLHTATFVKHWNQEIGDEIPLLKRSTFKRNKEAKTFFFSKCLFWVDKKCIKRHTNKTGQENARERDSYLVLEKIEILCVAARFSFPSFKKLFGNTICTTLFSPPVNNIFRVLANIEIIPSTYKVSIWLCIY